MNTRTSLAPASPDAGAFADPATAGLSPRRLWRGLALVVLAALAARLAVLHPVLDTYEFLKYPTLAAQLLHHAPAEPFNASPLYIYFWCLMHRLFDYTTLGPRLVQLGLGSLSAGLIYLLALRYVSWGWALATGLAGAAYAPFIVHDGVFLSEFLVVLLNTGALVCFHCGRDRGRPSWWLAGGLLWGLSAITRPNIVLLAPALVWWASLGPGASRRRNIMAALGACALAALFVTGVTVRNWRVGGEPIVVMSDGGIVFYIANNELDRGLSPIWPRSDALWALGQLDPTHRLAREAAARLTGRPLTIAATSRFWFGRGLDFARHRPGPWLWLCARKLWYGANGYELPDTMAQYAAFSGLRQWWWVRLGLVAPLALLGLAVAAPLWRRHVLLYGYVLVYVLTGLLFGMESRYRLPIVPGLLVCAAVGGVWLVRSVQGGRWRALAPAVLALCALAVSCNWRDFEIRKADARLEVNYRLFDHGAALVDKGKYAEAIPVLQAVTRDRRVYEAVVDADTLLAQAYKALGDRAAAERAFQEGVGPLCTDRVANLPVPARRALENEARRRPDDVFALRQLGYVAWREGDLPAAERCFRRVIWRAPAHAPGHFNLAVVLLGLGQAEAGRHELDVALDLMPTMAPAQLLREELPAENR